MPNDVSINKDINLDSIIDSEIDNLDMQKIDDNELKIESLDLNMDDLSLLEEVYIDKPNVQLNIDNLEQTNKNEPISIKEKENNTIKTIFIDTKEKENKYKNISTDTEMEFPISEPDSDIEQEKKSRYTKKEFSFFS